MAAMDGEVKPATTDHLPATQVQAMFGRVAARYDLANRIMTLGMDRRWRRLIQDRAALSDGERLLDLATGTGQLALDARRRCASAEIVAADLTPEMLRLARRRPGAETIDWMQVDARQLPFPDASFDVITHGYLLRYLTADMEAALREQWRVLRPGGRLVALDSSPGRAGVIGSVAVWVAGRWPRLVGRVVTRHPEDYGFLQDSTLAFMSARSSTIEPRAGLSVFSNRSPQNRLPSAVRMPMEPLECPGM